MPIMPGFIGPAYQSESIAENAQRCVNFYLEQDPTGKQPLALYGTPGLRLLLEIGFGPIRAMLPCGDSLLVLSNNTLYRIQADYTATVLLTISTLVGQAYMAQAGTAALVVDGVNGYWVDFSLSIWSAGIVTSADFPANPATCTAMDGYFITHTLGLQQYQISSPFDPKTWDAADTGSKEGHNDPIARVIAVYRELVVMGTQTTEIHQDTGAADFPFVRIDGAFIEQGTAAPLSVIDIDGAVLWLGSSKVGNCMAWRMQGFTPVRISESAIENAWSQYSTTDDAQGWAYQDKGHAFYVVSFPTAKATWCFDITTQLWHERPYLNPQNGLFEQNRVGTHAFFNETHIVGDRTSGKLYALDRDVYSDNGDPLVALRTGPHLFNAGRRGFLSLVEFFMEPGVGNTDAPDPQVTLRVSKDGGKTFGYSRTRSLGAVGDYQQRVRFNRVTNARDMVIEMSISDPVKRVLIGANVEMS